MTKTPTKELHILNLGAGVQSTTLYLMSTYGSAIVPWFDAAIFADTGEEPTEVYRHLEWMISLKGPEILVASIGRLGDDLIHGRNSRFASIPAFTINHGVVDADIGRTRRQCSREYKTEVVEQTIRQRVLGLRPRQHAPKDVAVFQYFGISLDEQSRASRIWERFHVEKSTLWRPVFPLVDRQFTRANCLLWLERFGKVPHEVPRSACVFCPFKSDAEWLRLKRRGGDDWSRAVQIDHALRTTGAVANRDMEQTMYVHRSCVPLDEVVFRPRENPKEKQLGFAVECEGVCGV